MNPTNYKVLFAMMGMEIGGAETHVLELSKALKERGISVIVVSNGGAFVPELEASGILHIHAPLNNRKPKSLLRSYKILKKVIVEEKISLVHAHARIPAFLCGMLQKKLRFRFVTTAHWVFNTAFHLRVLTNWGERSLAVSNDIKQYLIDNYHIKPENILVTVNGFDMRKFSRDVDFSGVFKEFSFDSGKKRILSVSRLDKDRSLAALRLIDIAEQLDAEFPVEIVIVGGGNDFAEVRKRAEAVNSRANKRLIILTGPRTDTNAFIAACDVFVNVSRSALEAMCAEKPVILAGNEGYLGIFDEKTLPDAVETNFCCRGFEMTEKDNLLRDLRVLLSADIEYLRRLGEFGRSVIKEHYSADKMADDAIALYETVRSPEKKKTVDAVISGYYGFHNHGDDTLLTAIIDDLRQKKPDINITVLSKRPKETSALYNVSSINRFNLPAIWLLFRKTRLLISGGGTLIQDLTSTMSLEYYLFIMRMAKRLGAKVMLYANGIDPVKEKNKKKAAKTLKKLDLITLRDNDSLNSLSRLSVSGDNIYVAADTVFSLKNSEPGAGRNLLRKMGVSRRFFVISVREWDSLRDDFANQMTEYCDKVKELYGFECLFLVMQQQKDLKLSKKICFQMKDPGLMIPLDYTISEILGICEAAEFVCSMRLHALIYALKSATPVIGLVYNPKVKGIMEDYSLTEYMPVEETETEKLMSFTHVVIGNRESIKVRIAKKTNEAEEKSARCAESAINLITREF